MVPLQIGTFNGPGSVLLHLSRATVEAPNSVEQWLKPELHNLLLRMKCLSKQEITSWIRKCGQVVDPYLEEFQPPFKVMCYAPTSYAAIEAFTWVIFNRVVEKGHILL